MFDGDNKAQECVTLKNDSGCLKEKTLPKFRISTAATYSSIEDRNQQTNADPVNLPEAGFSTFSEHV